MGQLGIGAMLSILSGSDNSAFQAAIGKTITKLWIDPEEDSSLRFEFSDGSKLRLWDDARSCCENRYMKTDDDLDQYLGSTLVGAEVLPGPTVNDEHDGDVHEIVFLHVSTSKGTFVCNTYNEHNGYYGGITIRAE